MQIQRIPYGLVTTSNSEAETDQIGSALAAVIAPNTVIGLVGPLGAGKTRLARAFALALGVDPTAIASPTFVLIHEYDGRLPVFHFDAYRLRHPDEFEALGPGDYFEAGGVCLVEWADRVAGSLPARRWTITLEPVGDCRHIRIEWPRDEASGYALADRLAAQPGD